MAGDLSGLWLLIRVAAQNLGKRPVRAVLLGVSVMLGCGVGFASVVCGSALLSGITTSLSRMGADLLVVPRGTFVNITASLLTVQPTEETLDARLAESLAAIPGVARVARQRLLRLPINGTEANLIAFDPSDDFAIVPWLGDHLPGPLQGTALIVGARVQGRPGQTLTICGKPVEVYGRLGLTGVGPFDGSYFASFATLAALAAGCSPSSTSFDAAASRVSAFMVRLAPEARLADVKFAMGQIPNVRIVEGNPILTSSRQALASLMIGIGISNVFQFAALLIVVSLLFSAIVQERYREVGLLRALGAKPNQIMTVMLAEAAIVTGLGGLAGLGFGVALIIVFARSFGFYFDSLGVPFTWPPLVMLEASAAVAVALSIVIGFVGAFLPAWRVRRMEPHALVQAETK